MSRHGWGWGIFMIILWLLFFAIIAYAVIRLLHHHENSSRIGTGERNNNSPLDIVKQRYAKGEIKKAEYDQLIKDLK
ncbi:MAG: SHOCT domain-containing protein [Candidatus Saccharimonadales bacterium]